MKPNVYSNRVTIKTIAEAVGVTHGTVSRALRGDPRVRTETALEVQSVAERLGYQPSRLARALKTSQTGSLAIVVSYVHDPFYAEVVQAVHDRLFPLEYNLLMAATESDPHRQSLVVQGFLEQSVDGVFVCCLPGLTPPFQSLSKRMPVVTINCDPSLHHAGVVHNDAEAMKRTMMYLVELGHRRIAYFGADNGGYAQRVRRKSFFDLAESLSLVPCEISSKDVKIDVAYNRALEWLKEKSIQRPSAVVCFNDTVAIGLMKACRTLNISVPEDLSLVGFDDIEMADCVTPGLTTFSQPRYEMGRVATETMMSLLSGGQVLKPTEFLGKLMMRGTVGSVP